MRAWAVALVALAVGCSEPTTVARRGVLTVSQEQQASWVRNFNPLLATGNARFPTTGGIYEPLAIYSGTTGAFVPWLATSWAWEDDGRTLRVTLREGVRWSDGAPFGADDVAFTFDLVRRFPALDAGGLWTFLAGVEAAGEHEVVFRFARVYVPGLTDVLHTPMVPRHVWAQVDDPVTFANPDPVATGPFTEVTRFERQVWELSRNPDWWGGLPAVPTLRFPAFPTNEQATLALLDGEVDWAGNFVPAIDRIYVARDPEHHHYWFPPLGSTIFLYANTTRAPWSDRRVRQAVSMAVDRDQIVKVAMYDYTEPSDATGLSGLHDRWRSEEAVAEGAWWVTHDPERAGALLDEAGYPRGPDGLRRGPDGAPLVVAISCVAGWSDWVRAGQVAARNLEALGVEAHLETRDFGAWFERVQRGEFDLAIGWSAERPTPDGFYRGLMATETVVPVGQPAISNWHRYGSPEASALLRAFEVTSDPDEQAALADAMQVLFAREAPAIPLFPSPAWGEYNTSRFEGFPSADDPYARLSPNYQPETLLVLARLRPVDEALARREGP